ncbi:D-alanyl-D-alanine carboxypeptidase [Enterovirga sp.]|uniref:D-alanyl-D-alanine carboxypeptidase n=1 Tax=Enterovirga sp. TaxID=2026350 RepID=UPI002625F53B|nr:D-alanyl-D-alanine carboxypeptidase [Enterovirga sp.]
MFAGLAAFLAVTIAPTEADARRKQVRNQARSSHQVARKAAPRNVYAPPFSAMIVDAKTGRTLYGQSEDEIRHPASVTKVMTLYLLFEQVERGNLRLDSELKVSRHAASMAPSKLGLRPGETIAVEDAILSLVTKSANDVAAVIAENIAGSEPAFAERMTRKARQLGMSRTVYRNASGLPDRAQVTTARDLVILGRAIQERFPRLYKYFGTRSFEYADRVIGNHNRLLGRIEGVDGIKTGFTNASGFNLLTSARHDGRHVVGVVLGGRSGASRDATMANLIRTHLARASTTGNSSVLASAVDEDGDGPEPIRTRTASAESISEALEEKPRRAEEPIRQVVAAAEAPRAAVALLPQTGKIDGRLPAMPAVPAPPESPFRVETTASINRTAPAPIRVETTASINRTAPTPVRQAEAAPVRDKVQPAPQAAARDAAPSAKPVATTPWVIQLAAESDEDKARELLAEAKSRSGRALAKAAPFTEKVTRAGSTLYRARFSGFAEAESAQEACKSLRSRGYACFATRS